MKFNIPYKDRGEIYQRVADECGVPVHKVARVNNERSNDLRVLEKLIYEYELYKKRKEANFSKLESLK